MRSSDFLAEGEVQRSRLRISGVRKSFGSTQALKNVSLEIAPGEVHALIGENGAGKSTLMKILSGAYQADAGEIYLNGELYTPRDPLQARRSGVEMIYQELNLAPHLSVEENILLGSEPSRFGWVDRKERRRKAEQALAGLHHTSIPLDAPIYSRPIAEQQMVEIARALLGSPQVLIMDEPTSSLTQWDTENLFAAIEKLSARGVSIIYISHFLEECQRIADRYTVLRDGEAVAHGEMADANLDEIIHQMVGRELDEIYPAIPHEIGEPVLELRHVAGKRRPEDASLTIRKGEIVGLAGLIGAGRTETLRVLFGLDRLEGGEIILNGRRMHFSPAGGLKHGLGMLSENRKEEGLMLNLSLAENLTLPRLTPFSRAGLLDTAAQRNTTANWMSRLKVRARHPLQSIGELSGGNQQKIAIGRLLHSEADILLLDEPTRGIDVASKAQIYELIEELAANGKSIVFVSSYLPELLGVCDTIAVMCRGRIVDTRPVAEWTEHSIIAAAIGQQC
jgi:ribose transport system ATP-binding protein